MLTKKKCKIVVPSLMNNEKVERKKSKSLKLLLIASLDQWPVDNAYKSI